MGWRGHATQSEYLRNTRGDASRTLKSYDSLACINKFSLTRGPSPHNSCTIQTTNVIRTDAVRCCHFFIRVSFIFPGFDQRWDLTSRR